MTCYCDGWLMGWDIFDHALFSAVSSGLGRDEGINNHSLKKWMNIIVPLPSHTKPENRMHSCCVWDLWEKRNLVCYFSYFHWLFNKNVPFISSGPFLPFQYHHLTYGPQVHDKLCVEWVWVSSHTRVSSHITGDIWQWQWRGAQRSDIAICRYFPLWRQVWVWMGLKLGKRKW